MLCSGRFLIPYILCNSLSTWRLSVWPTARRRHRELLRKVQETFTQVLRELWKELFNLSELVKKKRTHLNGVRLEFMEQNDLSFIDSEIHLQVFLIWDRSREKLKHTNNESVSFFLGSRVWFFSFFCELLVNFSSDFCLQQLIPNLINAT